MEKLKIIHNRVDEAISIMKEDAEWLTKEELITEEAQPFNFCVGKIGK